MMYVVRRIGQSIVTVVVMAALVFLAVYAVGNPVDILANPQASQQELTAIAQRLGLDRPLYEQIGLFVWNVLHGDLGRSFVYGEPAIRLILSRLPATLELALVAFVFAVVLGIPLGMFAGLRPESLFGRSIMVGSILGFSLPGFWQGLMLILTFSVTLGWLPAGGRGETAAFLGLRSGLFTLDGLRHLLLPALNLALFEIALVIRLVAAATREVALQDYVRFARAKGLSPQRIVGIHIFKNTLIPVVTVLGLDFGALLAFAVVTETVFAYPGMGKLLIDSINRLDRPVIVAYLMLTVVIFAVINLAVDLIYAAIDPRVRLKEVEE